MTGTIAAPWSRAHCVCSRQALVVGLVVVAFLSAPRAYAQPEDRSLQKVRQAGILRWGGDIQGGEPFVFEDPAHPGQLIGFEVEIAAAIAERLGVRPEFVQNDWSTLVPSLERGTFDMILNGLEVTPARQRRVHFTRPYHIFAERLVAREGDRRVNGLPSLRGLRVGTLANSLAWDLLGITGAQRIPYEGQDEPFIDLQRGRTDAVVIDDIIAARYGRRPGLVAVGNVGSGKYAIGIRQADQQLWSAVDEALVTLAQSGKLREIFARWQVVRAPDRPTPSMGPLTPPVSRLHPLALAQLLLFVRGAAITLLISLAAMALAVCWGLALAVARLPAPGRWRRLGAIVATAYIELLRGTPVLLQLFVIYYGLAGLLPLPAYVAAILGLGLNYAAYEAEIYRAGIQAVPRGQIEAAQALGMTGALAFRRVVLPQALRVSLPGIANDFIALLKDSSLVSVITVVELTKRMTIVAVENGGWLVPGLLCAALYFAMSFPLSRLARRLEHRLGLLT